MINYTVSLRMQRSGMKQSQRLGLLRKPRNDNYELQITNYELLRLLRKPRNDNYELQITNYELLRLLRKPRNDCKCFCLGSEVPTLPQAVSVGFLSHLPLLCEEHSKT